MKKILLYLLLIIPFLGNCQSLFKKDYSIFRVYMGEAVINNERIKLASSDSNQLIRFDGTKWTNWTPNFVDSTFIYGDTLFVYQKDSIIKTTLSYLRLDQTDVQTITGGIPLLDSTRIIDQDHEIIDKFYCDSSMATIASGGVKSFYFTKINSDVSGMFKAIDTIPSGAVDTLIRTIGDGETLLCEFISDVSRYRVTEGYRFFYITARATNISKTIQLRGEIYTCNLSGGNQQLLRQSSISPALTLSDVEYMMNVYGNSILIEDTIRIIFKIYAEKVSGGSSPNVILSIGDDTFSRLDVPVPSISLSDIVETDPIYGNDSANIIFWKDTTLINIDTSQVKNLETFVENHSTGGTTTNSIKITYTGIPQSPLLLPLSTNSIAIVSVDSATGQQTYTGMNGPVLDNFSYTENSATTGNLITSFSFDDLVGCESTFSFSGLSSCTSFSAPKLKYIGGALTIGTMASCTSINLDSLYYVNGTMSFSALSNLPILTTEKLYYVSGLLTYTGNSILTYLNLSNLYYCGGLTISSCPQITTVKIPSASIYANIIQLQSGNGNITYLKLGTIGILKKLVSNVNVSAQKLSAGSVDSTLTLLASLDGTNGTTLFGTGKTVNLSGGTSAAPTFTGSSVTQAGSSFVGSGTTCTVSWTGHGYTTGDLLTISGITTLTNANGTFEITVDNLNQFHYTITSQTATGAGTATVKKAGSTTEGYYYKQLLQVRGATVTTN